MEKYLGIVDTVKATKECNELENKSLPEGMESKQPESLVNSVAIAGNEQIQITDLPLEVIVQILDFLSLIERYNASLTCHLLYEAFNHPKLWRTQILLITGDPSNYPHLRNKYSQVLTPGQLPDKSRILIEKFGKYFQFLTIRIFGFLYSLTEWTTVLYELAKQCRLEKLTLEVGKMTTASDLYGNPPKQQDLKAILSFIENAFRMKSLDIKSWPIFPQTMRNDDQNIFKALMKNQKLKDLEELELFWPYAQQMWAERQPILPHCNLVLDLVQHLSSLHLIALRSTMLSDALLEELAESSRLRKFSLLKIFVTYTKDMSEFQIPSIKSTSWKKLSFANPDFKVECHVMPRVPNIELGSMLTFDCPLSKIVFLKWSRIDDLLLESLSNKFNQHLQSLALYCDFDNHDHYLIKLVEECKLLDHLDIRSRSSHGIHHTTVTKLALLRGNKWKTFTFDGKNISFLDKIDEDFDEDEVIRKNEKGEYYVVGMQKYNSEPQGEERQEKLIALKENIDKILGQTFVARSESIIMNRKVKG